MTFKYYSLLLLLILENAIFAQSGNLSLSSATAASGAASLNLSLTSAAASSSLQWAIDYAPSQVTAIQAAGGAALTAAGKSLTCTPGYGTYTCVADGLNSTMVQPGVVAVVNLTLAPALPGGSSVGVG